MDYTLLLSQSHHRFRVATSLFPVVPHCISVSSAHHSMSTRQISRICSMHPRLAQQLRQLQIQHNRDRLEKALQTSNQLHSCDSSSGDGQNYQGEGEAPFTSTGTLNRRLGHCVDPGADCVLPESDFLLSHEFLLHNLASFLPPLDTSEANDAKCAQSPWLFGIAIEMPAGRQLYQQYRQWPVTEASIEVQSSDPHERTQIQAGSSELSEATSATGSHSAVVPSLSGALRRARISEDAGGDRPVTLAIRLVIDLLDVDCKQITCISADAPLNVDWLFQILYKADLSAAMLLMDGA